MNATNITSPVIERVKKLLALSQSDNANERDAALAKANALIAEHNIDMVLVESSDASKPEAFEEKEIPLGARMPMEMRCVGWLIAQHFRCEIVYKTRYENGHRVRTFAIFGRASDAEFARWLAGYLVEEFRRRWAYYKNSTVAPASERTTFIYGMWKGLDARLREEQHALEQRKFEEIAQSQVAAPVADGVAGQVESMTADQLRGKYALAVQSEDDARDTAHKRLYPRLRNASSRLNIKGSSALTAGMASGRTISTNRPLAAAA